MQPGWTRIDTPVGVVDAVLHADGQVTRRQRAELPQAQAASPSRCRASGEVSGDIAWGGNWFFLVERPRAALDAANVDALTEFTWRVRQARATPQGYPEVDHVELFGPSAASGANSRNFVLCPGKAYDRSPCGTGTSAKLACLAADGKLRRGEVWVQESVIGSVFDGRYRWLRSRERRDRAVHHRHRARDGRSHVAPGSERSFPLGNSTAAL